MTSLADNLKTLSGIQHMCDNWNDYGASAFSKTIIDRAKCIINNLSIQPLIYPTANESVQFEFKNKNNDYLEFEIYGKGDIKMFIFYANGVYDIAKIEEKAIKETVENFYNLT